MIAGAPTWLMWDGVPLWAFLVAAFTRPATWSGYARDVVDRVLPGGES